MVEQKILEFRTRGRGTIEITDDVQRAVAATGIRKGICTVFLQHTSASLILCENADPDVRRDLETLLSRLAPVADGRLLLGTWQGLYLYEHRHAGYARSVVVTVMGER